jgi:hypothetical protein
LKDLIKRGKSDESIGWHVSAYIKPKFGKRNIDDVRPREILEYFQTMASDKPSTARSVFGTLRRMYEFAIARQIVDFSPLASIKPHVIAPKVATAAMHDLCSFVELTNTNQEAKALLNHHIEQAVPLLIVIEDGTFRLNVRMSELLHIEREKA